MAPRLLPILQSIPHAGLQAPEEYRSLLALDETAIYNECDLWVDQIYDFGHPSPGADAAHTLAVISTSIARGIVDANRPPDDLADPDGPIKAQTSYGVPAWVRPLELEEKMRLRDKHWSAYHTALEAALSRYHASVRLFLDCHSMAQRGPTTYAFAGEPRPFICLANLGGRDGEPLPGGEPTTCPGSLLRAAGELAERHFGDLELLEPDGPRPPVVALNWPFAGGYIIRRYTAGCAPTNPPRMTGHCALMAIMVEVNRGLYVGNQHAGTPPAPPNAERIADLRRRLSLWVQDLCAILK